MIKFFEKYPEILAVMSEREDGSMKLLKDSDLNLENRKRFFDKIGVGERKIVAAEIVHGATVEVVDSSSPEIILGADALVTLDKNIFLSITVADCIPVYFYEPKNGFFGIAHCGWRSIVEGIIKNIIEKFVELGGRMENLQVALGPGINQCHFEIKEDVLDKFKKYPEFIDKRSGAYFVDLKGIIKKQLTECDVDSENVENNEDCVFENKRYFSYRRDKTDPVEAMVAVIGEKNL
jgi:polyphenol oxidase